jgi:hypothetical protein
MNAAYAQERALAAEAFHHDHQAQSQAAWFAASAETLATASRAWRTLPPTSRAELDAIASHVEGLRRGIIELRMALPEK